MPEIPAVALCKSNGVGLRKPQPDMDLHLSDVPIAIRPQYLETEYQGFRLIGEVAEIFCCPDSRKWPIRKMSPR
jgi:hypothetical protein